MMEYSPLHPRSVTEGIVLVIAGMLWAFWQMPYAAFAVALINYGYAIHQHRHALSYQRWKKANPTKSEQKEAQQSDAEAKMQQLLDDRGFPAKVIGSIDSYRREVFEIRLPRSFSIKKLTGDIADIERATGIKRITIESSVSGKPGVSRIMVPKLKLPPPLLMKDVLETDGFKQSHPMALPLGMSLNGEHKYFRLDKMPHVAIAGTTGAGKSVEVNTWVTSLIVKNSPAELQLVLIDPKMLEFAIYEKSNHLATPVVTEMPDALSAINRLVNEMQFRYRCMKALKVRDLDAYNDKVKSGKHPISKLNSLSANDLPDDDSQYSHIGTHLQPFPRMVLVIDEMADLMMAYKSELEQPIARLAQKARACGIHMILATQRPEVSVITGLIKANIAARFSMQVATAVDSNIILDRNGAQNLLGNGDGYWAANQGEDLLNVQGFFIEADEIEAIIERENLK